MGVFFAVDGYCTPMRSNPVSNCTLIIHSQAEYSLGSQTLSVRFMLEIPSTGQHRGFADMEHLVTALRIELGEWVKLYHLSQRGKIMSEGGVTGRSDHVDLEAVLPATSNPSLDNAL